MAGIELKKTALEDVPAAETDYVMLSASEDGLPVVRDGSGAAIELATTNAVESIASGVVDGVVATLTKSDVGLSDVDNTSDLDKPISIAVADELSSIPRVPSPTVIKPLFWHRLQAEAACIHTPTNHANYAPTYLEKLTGTVSGSTFTATGGDPLQDFGTGTWGAVLQIGERHYFCVALSRTDNVVTITPPAPVSGTATLYCRHNSVQGQHYNLMGNTAHAEALYYDAIFEATQCVARYTPRYLHAADSVGFWRIVGALTNGADVAPYASQNITLSGIAVQAVSTRVCTANLATTKAVQLAIELPQEITGFVDLTLGHETPGAELTVELRQNGSVIQTRKSYGFVQKFRMPFTKSKDLEMRITNGTGSTIKARIGEVSVHENEVFRPFLLPREKLLVVGDSWCQETGSFPGFVHRLREIHDGEVVTQAVGGQTAEYVFVLEDGERRIDKWLRIHKPQVVVVHYYINDQSSPQSHTQQRWRQNINEICRTCIAAGVQPVVILPGATSDSSQTQSLQTYSDAFLVPPAVPTPVRGGVNDLASQESQVNNLAKYGGRIFRDEVSYKTYSACGVLPGDLWVNCYDPSDFVIPKKLTGNPVVLSDFVRFFGCAEQSTSILKDSSASATNGIVNGTASYAWHLGGIGRRVIYFEDSSESNAFADLGSSALLSSTGDWTVSLWVNLPAHTASRPLFCQTIGSGGVRLNIIDAVLTLSIAAQGSHSAISLTASSTTANKWWHIAIRRSGATFSLWRNGEQVATVTDADATRTIAAYGCLLGAQGFTLYNTGTSFRAAGRFADVGVASKALTDAQIAWLAQRTNYLI